MYRRNTTTKFHLLILLAALLLMAGCGGGAKKEHQPTIGLLLETLKEERWQKDRDYFVAAAEKVGNFPSEAVGH